MDNLDNHFDITRIAQAIFMVLKWLSVFGFIISVCGLSISIMDNYPLWLNPAKSSGTIVDYKGVYISNRSTTSAHWFEAQIPIVEFQDANGTKIKFEGTFGHNNDQRGEVVSVIYSNTNPKNAIIDLGVFQNWLSNYIWLFCTIASLLGIRRFSQKPNL